MLCTVAYRNRGFRRFNEPGARAPGGPESGAKKHHNPWRWRLTPLPRPGSRPSRPKAPPPLSAPRASSFSPWGPAEGIEGLRALLRHCCKILRILQTMFENHADCCSNWAVGHEHFVRCVKYFVCHRCSMQPKMSPRPSVSSSSTTHAREYSQSSVSNSRSLNAAVLYWEHYLDKLSKTFINCLLTCYIIFTLFYLYSLILLSCVLSTLNKLILYCTTSVCYTTHGDISKQKITAPWSITIVTSK